MVVLAEETIESTGLIEDGQIRVTAIFAPTTHPVGNAIGWKGIMVPISIRPATIRTSYPAADILPHAAISEFSVTDITAIHAKRTTDTADVIRH